MKLTTKQLKQMIKEELAYIIQEDNQMTEREVMAVIDMMKTEMAMALDLIGTLDLDNIDPDLKRQLVQGIWHNSIGMWANPEQQRLQNALHQAELGGYYDEIDMAEKALDEFFKNYGRNKKALFDLVGVKHMEDNAFHNVDEFQRFLQEKGVL
tara:strand:- start:186 stop:644 length:459 start_codon:yes stop_codon:yes gene_type:complete